MVQCGQLVIALGLHVSCTMPGRLIAYSLDYSTPRRRNMGKDDAYLVGAYAHLLLCHVTEAYNNNLTSGHIDHGAVPHRTWVALVFHDASHDTASTLHAALSRLARWAMSRPDTRPREHVVLGCIHCAWLWECRALHPMAGVRTTWPPPGEVFRLHPDRMALTTWFVKFGLWPVIDLRPRSLIARAAARP
jgi:hypothetical protein